MLLKSTISFLTFVQIAFSSPILTTRGDTNISCSSTQSYGGLNLINSNDAGPQWPVTLGTETNGQTIIEMAASQNAIQLPIIMQQCNSSYLGLSYSDQYEPGTNPVKFFFQYDITKCLQRLPNNNNQIVIGDCSNVDGPEQEFQFWDNYQPYQTITPISGSKGNIGDLGIGLADNTSGTLLANGGGFALLKT